MEHPLIAFPVMQGTMHIKVTWGMPVVHAIQQTAGNLPIMTTTSPYLN
jgi:hypothetical protein